MSPTQSSHFIDPLDIITRLDWGESDDLELKAAQGGLPRSLWETYSAMANSQGGVILLGIKDDGTVVGLKDTAKLKKDFWDIANNRGKVSLNLLHPDDVSEVNLPQGTILGIHVPRAGRYQRPVFLGQNPLTGTYRRNYEGDYRCTDQEVSRMLADRNEEPADIRILEYFTMEDLDFPSLQQYRNRFSAFKPTHPWLNLDEQGLLTKLGGWRKDRRTGLEGLTVAGLLMFGREESLREGLPGYHVDYRENLSDDPDVRWTDRFTVDGTWPGNLFQFYLRVIQRLSEDLKTPFQLDKDLFRKGETVVHEAIREALVNAMIHADYLGMGGIVIRKFRNRLEFSNPGSLLVSIDQLLRGNVSECRNKTLQTMFSLIGAGEKAGSGVDKIRRGWASQHWRDPIVTEQVQPDRVQWVLPMISMIPEASLENLKALFGKRLEKFTSLEVQALVTADLEGSVSNSRMRQISNKHPADLTRLLQNLVAQNALTQKGMGRWTRYLLPREGHSPHSDSVHKTIHSPHKADHSLHKDSHSPHKADHSLHKDSHSVHFTEISATDWDTLLKLAETARQNKRLAPQKIETLILLICQDHWLSRRQLGDLLQRNIEGLRARFLVPMVEHGLLRLRYPDKPNRVDQAYTTALNEEEDT
ncbi:MAG TPA: RNA-binding domain-containing protein [Desulfomicrobiaceae bacterium]|nr:RNA-binding domain-containing protein [Desulfomicrobiaceae bacterium]